MIYSMFRMVCVENGISKVPSENIEVIEVIEVLAKPRKPRKPRKPHSLSFCEPYHEPSHQSLVYTMILL